MSKPKPAMLRKWRFSIRPTSTRRSPPSTASRAVAAGSWTGAPRVLAKSLPVPEASSASRQSALEAPASRIAFATLLQVPSPPTATRVVAPSASARSASARSSPAAEVTSMPVTPTPANASRIAGSIVPPRPRPDIGFTITRTAARDEPERDMRAGSAAARVIARRSTPYRGGERLERVDELDAVAHPLLAERSGGDLVALDRAGEEVRVEDEAAALLLVLQERAAHLERRDVGAVLVVHERLVEVVDRLPAHVPAVGDLQRQDRLPALGGLHGDLAVAALERDVEITRIVRQVPHLDPVLARLRRRGADQERVHGRARHGLAVADAGRNDDRECDLLVGTDRAVVELERGDRQHAHPVVRLDRLEPVRKNRAGVVGSELEEPVDRVLVMVLARPFRHHRRPSSRSTWARIATPSLSWSWVCAAETEMRKRERCLATAG